MSNINYRFMAHLHNISRRQNPSLLSYLGNKVKQVAEIAGG